MALKPTYIEKAKNYAHELKKQIAHEQKRDPQVIEKSNRQQDTSGNLYDVYSLQARVVNFECKIHF